MTPQIDHLRKTSLFLKVITHIYEISREIDGKSFHLLSKARQVSPQIDCLRKSSPVLRVITHIYRISKGINNYENIHFSK